MHDEVRQCDRREPVGNGMALLCEQPGGRGPTRQVLLRCQPQCGNKPTGDRRIYSRILAFLFAWLFPAVAMANLCYWQPEARDIKCIDPESGKPVATIRLADEARAVETDSLGRSWILAGDQIVHVSELGNQDASVDLSALGLLPEARLRIDPYDGTAWLADPYRLVHVLLDGSAAGQFLVPEALTDFGVGLDQTVWILGDRTARQYDFRSDPAGKLVSSFDVTKLPAPPARLIPDQLNRAIWLIAKVEVYRFDIADPSKWQRAALPAGTTAVSLNPKLGALWILASEDLVEIDKLGRTHALTKLSALSIGKPHFVVPQPGKDGAWIGGERAIAWIGGDGTLKRTVRFPGEDVHALAGPAFAVSPSISLISPPSESFLSPGSKISLALGAKCGAAKCDMPPHYFAGFRVDAQLGISSLQFSINADRQTAWHRLQTLPERYSELAFSAVAEDAFGHRTAPVQARYLGRAVSPGSTGTSETSAGSAFATAPESARIAPENATTADPGSSQVTPAAASASAKAKDALARLPISFEPNNGQHHPAVKYAARGMGYGLFLSDDQLVLTLKKRKAASKADTNDRRGVAANDPTQADTGEAIRKRYPGSRTVRAIESEDLQEGKSHYLIGPDRSKWRTNVPRYAKVRYRDVFPGIDQVYYGKDGKIEYDWIVHPGADAIAIRESFAGAQKLTIAANGDLLIDLKQGQIVQHKPVAYQKSGEALLPVDAEYVLISATEVGFRLGPYDKSQTLYIDPVITYATYLGGSGTDQLNGIAADAAGNVYLAGWSVSDDYPTTNDLGGLPPITSGYVGRGVVTKLNPTGTAIIYSTYISGLWGGVEFKGIAVDSAGEVYLAGNTTARDLPLTSGAFQTSIPGTAFNASSAYLCKVSAAGNALSFATYFGTFATGEYDPIASIAIDSSGNSYVVGNTASPDFPTTPGAFQTTKPGSGTSAFVAKLNSTGSALLYSTYLGGTGTANDIGKSIAVDATGSAFIGGIARSADFPTTVDALRRVRGGAEDGFLVQLNPSGSALLWSTLLGGELPTGSTRYSGSDGVLGLALDGNGFLYATGYTNSTDFPVQFAHQSTMKGRIQSSAADGTWRTTNAFLTKIDLSNRQIYYSTFLGGEKCAYCWVTTSYFAQDGALGVAASPGGTATIVGYTVTDDFPILNAALPNLTKPDGTTSAGFVAQFSPAGRLNYSFPVTSRGIIRSGTARLVAMDGAENVYVGGDVTNDALVSSSGVIQPEQSTQLDNADSDGFVIKLAPSGPLQIRMASNLNPSIAGSLVTLTVSIEGGAAGLSGSMSWCDGDVCTALPPGGSGQLFNIAPVPLSVGTHSLTVRYAGDGVNPPTVSPVFVQVVNDPEPNAGAQASTTSLQSSSSTVSVGQTVTMTVTVSTAASFFCGQGLTAGQVELFDSGIPVGTLKTSPSTSTTIRPSFTLKWPSPGTHYLTARYSGSPCATSSASNPVAVTVDDFAPQIVISTPANGARFQSGSTITLGAIAASPGGRTISSVKFLASSAGANGVFVGTTATAAPYTTTWSKSLSGATGGVPTGTYQISADVTDSSGVTVRSAPITIEVAPATAIGESITYLHNDVTGNTVMATNEAGSVLWKESYRPYGERLRNESASAANRQFFHGKAYDSESGLQYFGARYYDPVVGRFMGVDPVGFDARNLHSFNRYAYGNNNPYKYTDRDGRFAILIPIVGLVVGGGLAVVANHPARPYGSSGSIENSVPGFGAGSSTRRWGRLFSEEANQAQGQGRSAENHVPLPDVIVGDQSDPRAGPSKGGGKHTSGPLAPENGGTGDFESDLQRLTGGVRPWQPGDKAPPGSLVGENGIFGRPVNSSGGKSIDIPANGKKPHETLHYP